MGKLKQLAGETALYGLGAILPRMINFFLVIPQTAAFRPDEYGVITDLYAFVAFLNIVYTFGLETAYFRFSTRPGADPNKVFQWAQTAVTAISLALTALLILFSNPIATGAGIPGQPEYIVWLALIMGTDALVAIPFARLRLQKKALAFALAKVFNVALVAGLNIYFLQFAYDPSIGVAYVFLINLIANAFYLPFFAKTFLSWRPAFDRAVFKGMFSYSWPIMVAGLAGMTNEMFSRVSLTWWLPDNFYGVGKSSAYALGVFGACYKFAVLMNLVIQAFRYAAEPFFFSQSSDKNSPELFARVNHFFVLACCTVLLAVGINLDVLKHLLRDPAYWEGLDIVPVLLLGYLFLGVYYNFTVWFKLTDKTHYGTWITAGGAVLTIALNFILIPIWGYMGSSWATLACYFSMAVACYLIGQKHYPIPYTVGRDLLAILLTVALVYGINLFPIENIMASIAVHSIIVLVFLGVLYGAERKHIRS